MMRRILVWFALLLIAPLARAEPTALEHLAVFLTGTFSNAAQARGDHNFRNITLHIAPIWSGRSDGPWLYSEQALADAPTHPYRQALYQLVSRSDDTIEIRLFDVPDPIAATGSWKDATRMEKWTPADLTPRSGCNLIMRLQAGGIFKGGTEGKGCASVLRGASYSSVEAIVSNLEITLWERGYNDAGAQVWGSIHGGNALKRVE